MSIEIKAPTFPESVADGTIANWIKKEGESVNQDEVIAEIETDKVVLEVLAQSNGVVSKILKTEGETVLSSEIIGEFSESEGKPETLKKNNETIVDLKEDKNEETEVERDNKKISPAAKKIIIENNIETEDVKSSGKNNRITKADVINHISSDIEATSKLSEFSEDERPQKRVPMSRLRSTIAKRLVSVKQDTAMLTTFNEVDMLPIKDLRSKYGEEFEKEHGVK